MERNDPRARRPAEDVCIPVPAVGRKETLMLTNVRGRQPAATLSIVLSILPCLPALSQERAAAPTILDEIVVTSTGRPEPRSRITGTVQVIEREAIAQSSARSVTELMAENAVGFFSEWTPGQTSINIRGGASDGQGKDFRSQILVLINGRRAGTANISKLSPRTSSGSR